jgi:uncharacterized protein involved in exopolysaccharide biosynthesis
MGYMNILWHWRRFLIINVLVVAFITAGVTLLLPVWYKSTASILAPKDAGMFGGLGMGSSLIKDLAGGALGSFSSGEGAYNYFAILSSRTVMEKVARKFDLMTVYDVSNSSMEKTLEALAENVAFEEQEDEYITIDVLDQDPQRAADMANTFVHLLNEISIRLATEEARNNREFIERQLATTREDLRKSEDSLKVYQEQTGTVIAVDPAGGSVSPIAELYALKARKEIELAILRRTASEDNTLVRQLQVELSEINRKVSKFPSMGISSLRLYRDVAIQQKILEFLVPLYEQAKVDEQKDVPVLLVLDHAVPAELKTKPQRGLIVVVITTLAAMALIAMIFPLDRLLRSTHQKGEIDRILERFARWIISRYRIKMP